MSARNTQAVRTPNRPPVPAWVYLLTGMLGGIVLAVVVMRMEWLPGPRDEGTRDAPVAELSEPIDAVPLDAAPARPTFDFYTVLPEMEVVVPEEEIAERAAQLDDVPQAGRAYLIQVGAFRSDADAEALKARLAMSGLVARVQRVTIDDAAWFRVRLGPFETARELDEVKREIEAQGLQAVALRDAAE